MAVVQNRRYRMLLRATVEKTPVEKTPTTQSIIPPPKLVREAKSVLVNFIQRTDISSYENLICELGDNEIEDEDLQQLLSDVRQVISLLDTNLHHFVEVLLSLKWYYRCHDVVEEYQHFLIDLLLAHNYYVRYALKKLVFSFGRGVAEKAEWPDGLPTTEDKIWFTNIHDVLKVLLKVIPMSCTILHEELISQFPYFKNSAHAHETYVYNMLKITEYRSDLRLDILRGIINKVICLDVNAPKEEITDYEWEGADDSEQEIFNMDESDELKDVTSGRMRHPIANTLDIVLTQLFKYFNGVCFSNNTQLDWDKAKSLYQDLLVVFEQLILPTHRAYHVQFIMFYLCSFKVTIAEAFLNSLWRKVLSPHQAPIIRQTAVLYIASFLARAMFVPVSILKDVISKAATWIHNYISNQDGLESTNSDIRIHSVFFSVCQALFYLIAFRHSDLVDSRKNLTFLQSLNLTKIVTCRLNPLKVCIPPVVQNFAAVTRKYQLAYCYTIIEHNSRNVMPIVYIDESGMQSVLTYKYLETFFPFDPFLLVRAGKAISPIYREYRAAQSTTEEVASVLQSANEEVEQVLESEEEDDDFLVDQGPSTSSSIHPGIFSYSSSPGFKH